MKQLALLFVLAACGSSSKPAATPTPAPAAWKDMNLDQRVEFMKREVMPKSKAIFVAFDEAKYKDMDCATCHGDGAADGSFEMPNPKIKPLPATADAFMAWVSKDEEAARYAKMMSEQLEPMMANLLGKKAFDPATKTGDFSCEACHTMATEK